MTQPFEARSGIRWVRWRKAAVVALATGTMFSSSCSSETVRAVIDGIDAAAGSLDRSLSGQDQTFGEWLLGELAD